MVSRSRACNDLRVKRFPFPAYPTGWFAVGFSTDFAPESVTTRHYFGQDLVVYRTRDGVVHATEPHCPHLGAHFGHGGRVDGERLRCPFHGWCFDGKGQCVEIPGAERIPPRAVVRHWPLVEQNGVVFVRHDGDDATAPWSLAPLPDEEWTKNRTVMWTLRTHAQEVCENAVDSAHLTPLHHIDKASVLREPTEDGPMFNIALHLVADGGLVGMPGMTNDVVLDVTLHGLGQMVVQTHVRNVGIRARQRIYCTPVDEEHTEVRAVVNLVKLEDAATTEQVAELFYQAYLNDFAKDFPVWENKAYRERPILSSADGPFMRYRKWARQFYGVSTVSAPSA
jgi:phenylpropionate dioxygenase-like ring-hydroxylating dioxygenase large terminal subunit